MGDKKTIKDFGYDFDAYTRYQVGLLVAEVHEVAQQNGCSPQEALDAMFKASVNHARRLRRNRLAQGN